MNSITSTTTLPAQSLSSPSLKLGGNDGESSFKDLLVDSIKQVNGMQLEADKAVEALFTGEEVNPAEVLTAVQKADMAFQLTMQLRNKAMDVYREIRDIRI